MIDKGCALCMAFKFLGGCMNWIFLIIGVLIGIVVSSYFVSHSSVHGYMRVDESNPEKDLYSLELACDLNIIASKKWIFLKVIHDDRTR